MSLSPTPKHRVRYWKPSTPGSFAQLLRNHHDYPLEAVLLLHLAVHDPEASPLEAAEVAQIHIYPHRCMGFGREFTIAAPPEIWQKAAQIVTFPPDSA